MDQNPSLCDAPPRPSAPPAFAIGDRVTWTHTSPSGYHYLVPVAGVVRKIGRVRVQIEIRVSEQFGRQWLVQHRWVARETLTPRIIPCAALFEPMEAYVRGFVVNPPHLSG